MNDAIDRQQLRQLMREALAARADDPDRALELFDTLLSYQPANTMALRHKALLLVRHHRFAEALPAWQALADLILGDAEAQFQLARLKARAGDLPRALSLAGHASELAPEQALAGFIKSASAEWETRLQSLRDLPAQQPTTPQPNPQPNPQHRLDDAILRVYGAVAAKAGLLDMLAALEGLAEFASGHADAHDVLRLQMPRLVDLFTAEGAALDAEQRAGTLRRIGMLAAEQFPHLLRLAMSAAAAGPIDAVTGLLRLAALLPNGAMEPALMPQMLEAARLAQAHSDHETAARLARRLLHLVTEHPASRLSFGTHATRLLTALGHVGETLEFWQHLDTPEGTPPVIEQRAGLIAALDTLGERQKVLDAAFHTLLDAAPIDALAPRDCNLLVGLVRRAVQAAQAGRLHRQIPAIEKALLARTGEDARGQIFFWVMAGLATARFAHKDALELLDQGRGRPPLSAKVVLDLTAERALLFGRYHFYGEALDEMRAVPQSHLTPGSFYANRLNFVRDISAFCPDAEQPLRYPECLVDIIFNAMNPDPIGYVPVERHLLMVSGSLGQGGGERQTLTMVRRILRDSRVDKLSLMVRSTHLKPSDDFFWPEVSRLPLDLLVYGKDWMRRTNVLEHIPELASRPRVAEAISLMPHNLREEVIRLVRQFLDRRPAAVHIWQDMFCAALACVVAGVPHFFIHRGSLSPDYWEHNDYQANVFFRVMRHTYRRLLERPDFLIANNSLAGCNTDQNWTTWPEAKPFHILYNAVDFTQLGVHSGRNDALRAELGIPPDSLVVGGSFRITPVKRPHIWIAASGIIAKAFPNAHFLIIGDGELTDDARAQAEQLGFGDRLHLPGRVSNVGDWYRAMDLKLLTSEREGIPNAIIEAQHYGCPIVATDVGGIAEAIEPGITGYVIPGPPGGAPAEPYAETVIRIFNDKAWHDHARQRAQDYVHTRFSLDNIVHQLLGYYGFPTEMPDAARQAATPMPFVAQPAATPAASLAPAPPVPAPPVPIAPEAVKLPPRPLDLTELRHLAFAGDADGWAHFTALLAEHPDDAALARLAGIKAYQIGRNADAIALLERASELADEDEEALLFLMRAYVIAQDPAQAASAAHRLLDRAPDDRDALRVLGRISNQNGETDTALACWQRAAALEPEDAEAAIQVARIVFRRHLLPEAADHAARVAEDAPWHAEAVQIQARALLGLGRHAAWAELMPHYFALARPQALDMLRQFAPLAPPEPVARALASLEAGAPEDRDLAALTDATLRHWRRLAASSETARDPQAAAICLRAMRILRPDAPDAAAGLARLASAALLRMRTELGHQSHAAACQAAEAALAIDPELHEAHFTLGRVRLLLDDAAGALAPLAAAVARQPRSPWYWLNQAQALDRTGQTGAAVAAYRQVVEMVPDVTNELAVEAQQALARLHRRAMRLARAALAGNDLDVAWEQVRTAEIASPSARPVAALRQRVLRLLHDEVATLHHEHSPDLIDAAEQYLRKDPDQRDVLVMLGRALMRGNEHRRALAVWERLIGHDAGDAQVQLQAARCCAWLDLPGRGALAAAAALRLDPANEEAGQLLARFQPEAGGGPGRVSRARSAGKPAPARRPARDE